MKLRNKKTGEIVEVESCNSTSGTIGLFFAEGRECDRAYSSLAELNEEWKDYEEPKEHWAIDQFGEPINVSGLSRFQLEKLHRLGNDFPSENATMKAVEKLKAWKRLKDKGFRFAGWGCENQKLYAKIQFNKKAWATETEPDLDLLFGGEE